MIIVNVIPERLQRYPTEGDYFMLHNVLHVAISKSNFIYEMGVLMHELGEWALCMERGISIESIDKWDMDHPELEDPGSHEDAPYHAEHMFMLDWETNFVEEIRRKTC